MDEQRVVETEHLRSAVLVARGSFHQLGNLLTLAGGFASLLKTSLGEGSEEGDLAIRIEQAVRRASRILEGTHEIMILEAGNHEPVDCSRTVLDVCGLMEAIFPRLRVVASVPEQAAHIAGSRSLLSEAIVHLVLLSSRSMQGTGEIHVGLRIPDEPATRVDLSVSIGGPGASLDTEEPAIHATRAIAGILGGDLSMEAAAGGRHMARLEFPLVFP